MRAHAAIHLAKYDVWGWQWGSVHRDIIPSNGDPNVGIFPMGMGTEAKVPLVAVGMEIGIMLPAPQRYPFSRLVYVFLFIAKNGSGIQAQI